MDPLFKSVQIRHLTIKNRIAVPAMIRYYWAKEDGAVSDMHICHYERVAQGGNGLIIQEATSISEQGRWVPDMLGIWRDGHIEGLSRMVEAVHRAGSKIFIQLQHSGVKSHYDSVGPSVHTLNGFSEPRNIRPAIHKTSRPLGIEEIEIIQEQFVSAAVRAVRAGYDGIELHGTHGYLIGNFLSKSANHRTDAYGENPALFAVETLGKIRAAVGSGPIIGIRMGGFEPTLDDGFRNALALADAGYDFLNVSYGESEQIPDQLPESYQFPPPIYAAQRIKKLVKVPVFGVYRITSAQMARDILSETEIDMVNIGRGVLVNPSWANDARSGDNTGICLNCEACQWRIDYTKCPGEIVYQKNKCKAD
ncbi:MAG: NADH:flavin oxidoreductase [Oscillospiraceae bacterium]|nr:NADH:flavin oxidoreductase [Oscillospiraceae bacterium]